MGEQQRVEILKALYRGAALLILDEPSSVLTPGEVEDLFGMIRRLTQEEKSLSSSHTNSMKLSLSAIA